MIRTAIIACCLATALPVQGQDQSTMQESVRSAPGGVLRGLDKLSGAVTDLNLSQGETGRLGSLEVTLGDCRYPADNPAGDAYAYVVIRESGADAPVFAGWMVASSPALNALEHPRYDVWALRCNT